MSLVTQNLAPREVDLFCPDFWGDSLGSSTLPSFPLATFDVSPSICPPNPSWMNEDPPIFRETTFPPYVGQGCWDCMISQWSPSAHSSPDWVPTTTILGFFFVYLVAPGLSCGTQDLWSFLQDQGSGSRTRDGNWAPPRPTSPPSRIGSEESVTRLPGKFPHPGNSK